MGRKHSRRIKVVVGSGSAECGRICVTGLNDGGRVLIWNNLVFEISLYNNSKLITFLISKFFVVRLL